MSGGVAFLIALALTGTVALCVALEVVPKFGKYGEEDAQRPKHFWLFFTSGCVILLIASYLALSWVYTEPKVEVAQNTGKYYHFPEKAWYFVTPNVCKTVMDGIKPYTPETFAARNECETEEVDGNPNLIKLNCREILNNIFFMIRGKAECDKLKAVMAREAGTESIFGYQPPDEE